MRSGYRGRLAPSPTGLLHLGHASTFWAAKLRAEAAGGVLLLRNEDLDPQRSRAEFVEAMLEDLAWLGIRWEPPMVVQSERGALYRAAFERLLTTGHVYPCSCSRRDLARMMHAPHEEMDDEPVYDGRCRPAVLQPVQTVEPGLNYRFRVPDGERVAFLDAHLGTQEFTAGVDFGDFLVWRKDGCRAISLPAWWTMPRWA